MAVTRHLACLNIAAFPCLLGKNAMKYSTDKTIKFVAHLMSSINHSSL